MGDPRGSGRNAGLLGGQPARPSRRALGPPSESRTELGAHPLARDFEQGPFAAAPVPPIPPEAVQILERRTGRPFDATLIGEWERVRAFVGYHGVVVADPGAMRLGDLRDRGPASAPSPNSRAEALRTAPAGPLAPPRPASAGMPDPSDLGDD